MDLSILIPSRNEMFLARTIQDIIEKATSDYEIIAILDGEWTDPPVPVHERVTVVHHPESIGQRAAINEAARLSIGKYLMKVDAHCAFAENFDGIMLEDMQPHYTMLPVMRNLHAFDWVCDKCGDRRYQGPTPVNCNKCDNTTDFTRDIQWIGKKSPQSTAYRFDKDMHFQYWSAYKRRQNTGHHLVKTLCIQGSCFMVSREKFFELELCDERHGSWGQQGVEVALKTWLSGGQVLVNKRTWYAHMFRTQGGDFGFPYPNPGISKAREYSRNLWLNDKWEKAIHPMSWLIEQFAPVPDWPSLTKGILYYTDNRLDENIMKVCQDTLKCSADGRRIVSVGLQKTDFGDNITLPLERGYLTMFKQILAGLEELDCDVVFFCEHDVLYHPSHFQFTPDKQDKFYYNTNVWKIDANTGRAIHYDCNQTSGLCAYRRLLLEHYRKRVANTEEALARLGNTRQFRNWIRRQGFEPGTHHRSERVDDYKSESWQSEAPIVDIRHGKNLTPSRWSQDQFRDKRFCRNWIESDEIPFWGKADEIIKTLNG